MADARKRSFRKISHSATLQTSRPGGKATSTKVTAISFGRTQAARGTAWGIFIFGKAWGRTASCGISGSFEQLLQLHRTLMQYGRSKSVTIVCSGNAGSQTGIINVSLDRSTDMFQLVWKP